MTVTRGLLRRRGLSRPRGGRTWIQPRALYGTVRSGRARDRRQPMHVLGRTRDARQEPLRPR
ncbi:hypothetical protein SAMN05216533_3247 [Streptomyces sp. Ag109_O5-10]|nr:hypothetical protein SAMN05216533_3247 [Streptomyces sp. Ag109_O5-10]